MSPKHLPKFLRRITLPVVKRKVCERKWAAHFPGTTIKIQHICAGTEFKGTCKASIGIVIFCLSIKFTIDVNNKFYYKMYVDWSGNLKSFCFFLLYFREILAADLFKDWQIIRIVQFQLELLPIQQHPAQGLAFCRPFSQMSVLFVLGLSMKSSTFSN